MNSKSFRLKLSETSKQLGFSRWYDFSHKPTFAEKLENIIVVLVLNFVCMGVTLLFVNKVLMGEAQDTIQQWLKTPFIGVELLSKAQFPFEEKYFYLFFFMACILAPLWEEVVFRVFPIKFARILEFLIRSADKTLNWQLPKFHTIFYFVIVSSIIFGLAHGSVISILFQGVCGLGFAYIYIRNNDSYWSSVSYHSLWNLSITYILPWFAKLIDKG